MDNKGKMTINKTLIGLILVMVLVGLSGISYMIWGGIGQQTSLDGDGNQISAIQDAKACIPSSGLVNLKLKAIDTEAEPDTLRAVDYAVYLDGQTTAKVNGTTGTSGETTESSAVSCNDKFKVFFGSDETDAYIMESALLSSFKADELVEADGIMMIGGATLSAKNATASYGQNVSVSLGTSQDSVNDITIIISQNESQKFYGADGLALCGSYNTSIFNSVKFGAGFNKNVGSINSLQPDTDEAIICWENTGAVLTTNNNIEVPMEIDTLSTLNPGAEDITVCVLDKARFLEDGTLLSGYVTNTAPSTDIGGTTPVCVDILMA